MSSLRFLLFSKTFLLHNNPMKSAYELAMERLSKAAPTVKLTDEQKKQLAELDSRYAAKIAERELGLKDEIAAAAGAGDFEKVEELEKRLVLERQKIQAELEEKKDEIRNARK
jgi:molybdopterin converting factor small subunit